MVFVFVEYNGKTPRIPRVRLSVHAYHCCVCFMYSTAK